MEDNTLPATETIDLSVDVDKTNTAVENVAINLSGNANENVFEDEDIHFEFDTSSPQRIQDDGGELDEESVNELSSKRHENNDCRNVYTTSNNETYENNEFEWTETCEAINNSLPPSFSGSYLYVRDKTKPDTMYVPGVSIVNLPREKRDPEIFLCAVKCAKANTLNFLYTKIADVEAFFSGMNT